MSIFPPIKFGSKAEYLHPCTEAQAMQNLELAAQYIVKNARWVGLTPSKVTQLRRPLLQLKLARKAKV